MTPSFSQWQAVLVHFIANSNSGVHFKILLKLIRDRQGGLRYTASFGAQLAKPSPENCASY